MREIDPMIFGPGTWIATHVLALVSDQNEDYAFYSLYIYRMVHALPCGQCRKHGVRYIDKYPVPKSGSMFNWSIDFHNAVNKRLGKPEMSIEQAKTRYENTEIVLKNQTTGNTCKINGGGCEDSPI